MKKRLLLVAGLFFSLHCSLRAGDGDFAVSKIPAELLKSSNAVIRLHEQHIVLKHMEKMIIKERIVITVLNEKGDEYAYRGEGYDKFNSIESIEGTLYDHLGKKLKSLKK